MIVLNIDSRELGQCLDLAQEILKSTFGMELVDINSYSKIPNLISQDQLVHSQGMDVVIDNSEIMRDSTQMDISLTTMSQIPLSQIVHVQSAWILVNCLSSIQSECFTELSHIITKNQDDNCLFQGVLLFILCMLMTQTDGALRHRQLLEYIKRIDHGISIQYVETVLLPEYVRNQYLNCSRLQSILQGSDDAILQYTWGPRAKAEFPESSITAILTQIWPELTEKDIHDSYQRVICISSNEKVPIL